MGTNHNPSSKEQFELTMLSNPYDHEIASGFEADVIRSFSMSAKILCMDWNPEKSLLATCVGTACYCWNAETFALIKRFSRLKGGLHREPITCVQFNKAGKYLVTAASDNKVIIWDVDQQKCLHIIHMQETMEHLTFLRDDVNLAASSGVGKVHFWLAATGQPARIVEDGAGAAPLRVRSPPAQHQRSTHAGQLKSPRMKTTRRNHTSHVPHTVSFAYGVQCCQSSSHQDLLAFGLAE